MSHRIALAGILAFAAHAVTAQARPTDILVGIDGKTRWEANGPVNSEGGHDAILVLDASKPLHPTIRATLPLVNSVFGPPTNLQITPDGRLGLVASSLVTTKDGDVWKGTPDNRLHVIDLAAEPPKLVETITVGKQPSGLAISPKGDLALIANRAGRSVTVLSIHGTTVRQVAEVPMNDEVAAVAIAPDGKRAFAAKNLANKVAVLTIDGETVTTDPKQDVPVGLGVYNLDFTKDGSTLIAANTGNAGDGSAKTLSLIDARANPPRVIDTVGAADGPEGLAVSPDGRWAAVPLLLGTTALPSAWSFTKTGQTALYAIKGAHLSLVQTLPTGGIPEGVAWAPDSSAFYVGNYADKEITIFRVANGHLSEAGPRLKLPGQPASLRGPAR